MATLLSPIPVWAADVAINSVVNYDVCGNASGGSPGDCGSTLGTPSGKSVEITGSGGTTVNIYGALSQSPSQGTVSTQDKEITRMWAESKWRALFVGLLVLSGRVCPEESFYSRPLITPGDLSTSYTDNQRFTGDLGKPDQILIYLKVAPKKRKTMAESAYAHAQKHAARSQVSWGSVLKGSLESLSMYPTGKAFLLAVKADLNILAKLRQRESQTGENKEEIQKRHLEGVETWLNSAIVVEAYEPSLGDTQRSKLVPYRDCLKRYLDTGKAEPDCVPLQWAGIP
ncbi:hypothetical protein FACS1894158_11580 [Betaproteobacteria bacterium]|nr:hypothetical protein FACS1894158_11580 [Betaproteobacteria bacterium]